jgi:hypothetical protein
MPRVLVIMPAFNEEASVASVVSEVMETWPEYDVVVVDDGSMDATAERVPLGAHLIRLPFNLGIGGAMQTGYRYAAMHGYDVAVQVDGDGQHPPARIGGLVERLASGDVNLVIGSRFLEDTGYQQSGARIAGTAILRALLEALTGRTFTDCTSGFRAVDRRLIRAFAHWYPEDFPEPEAILLAHRAGFAIAEKSVRMNERSTGRSSISLSRGVFYVLKVCLALLLNTVRQPWPRELRAR